MTEFVNRLDWSPTSNSVICANHFDQKFILNGKRKKLNWKLNPVPTIYTESVLLKPSSLLTLTGFKKSPLLLLLLSASPYSGSPQRDSNLHFTRSTSSPSLAPTLSMSSLTKSIHLLLGLPLFLLPGTAISIILFPT